MRSWSIRSHRRRRCDGACSQEKCRDPRSRAIVREKNESADVEEFDQRSTKFESPCRQCVMIQSLSPIVDLRLIQEPASAASGRSAVEATGSSERIVVSEEALFSPEEHREQEDNSIRTRVRTQPAEQVSDGIAGPDVPAGELRRTATDIRVHRQGVFDFGEVPPITAAEDNLVVDRVLHGARRISHAHVRKAETTREYIWAISPQSRAPYVAACFGREYF